MKTLTIKFYPSAPLEKVDLEQRVEKKNNDVNNFNNSINNVKEMITYFKEKNHKSKKKIKKESVETIVFIGGTSTSITLSNTGNSLVALTKSAGVAFALSLGEELLELSHKIIMYKHNLYKKTMKKINKQIDLLINYIGNLYKIIN